MNISTDSCTSGLNKIRISLERKFCSESDGRGGDIELLSLKKAVKTNNGNKSDAASNTSGNFMRYKTEVMKKGFIRGQGFNTFSTQQNCVGEATTPTPLNTHQKPSTLHTGRE